MLVQLVMPLTPVIVQLPAAVGVLPPVGPVTVALKVMAPPSAALAAPALTLRAGVYLATEVV